MMPHWLRTQHQLESAKSGGLSKAAPIKAFTQQLVCRTCPGACLLRERGVEHASLAKPSQQACCAPEDPTKGHILAKHQSSAAQRALWWLLSGCKCISRFKWTDFCYTPALQSPWQYLLWISVQGNRQRIVHGLAQVDFWV